MKSKTLIKIAGAGLLVYLIFKSSKKSEAPKETPKSSGGGGGGGMASSPIIPIYPSFGVPSTTINTVVGPNTGGTLFNPNPNLITQKETTGTKAETTKTGDNQNTTYKTQGEVTGGGITGGGTGQGTGYTTSGGSGSNVLTKDGAGSGTNTGGGLVVNMDGFSKPKKGLHLDHFRK